MGRKVWKLEELEDIAANFKTDHKGLAAKYQVSENAIYKTFYRIKDGIIHKRNNFRADEEAYLINNWSRYSLQELAIALGRQKEGIKKKAIQLRKLGYDLPYKTPARVPRPKKPKQKKEEVPSKKKEKKSVVKFQTKVIDTSQYVHVRIDSRTWKLRKKTECQ